MRIIYRLAFIFLMPAALSGCSAAADAFFKAGDSLFQPGATETASMRTYSVSEFIKPYSENPVKANKALLGKWVKVKGVVTDISKVSGVAESYSFIVSLKDESKNNVIMFQFGSHNTADVEQLRIGSSATIVGQVHNSNNAMLPVLQNPSVVK
ncbi:OB-fold putative lipoprotein [Enterobacter sp. ENT03]|uniref:OB-fold putative lipoprotein n=1 Tax=Enterobacter sp. ENT03 TaxID=2854780 RepID=UPI001C47B77A|nr:OB-fold putative lipoprotein [Enterobacter sp. ENT03]